MYNECIQNFLNKSHPSSADRYSDSSDFEIPSKYFRVAAKIAIHTSKSHNENRCLTKQHADLCNAQVSTQYCINSENNISLNNMFKSIERRCRKESQIEENYSNIYFNNGKDHGNYIKRSHGNIDIVRDLNIVNHESCMKDKLSSSTETEDSNSSNSSNKNNHFINSSSKGKIKIRASRVNKVVNIQRQKCDKLIWRPKKLKKVGNDVESYTIHPIYVIERNNNVKNVTSSKNENSAEAVPVYCSSCCSISFAESEKEIFKRSYHISTVSKQNDAPNENKSIASNSANSPQYSLKRNISTPCHMSPIYESKSVSTDLKIIDKLTSSSSAFWNFLSDKVHRKHSKKKDSRSKYLRDTYNISYHQGIIENTVTVDKQMLTTETTLSDAKIRINEINQTEFLGRDKNCQCNYGSTKLEILSDINKSEITKDSSEIPKSKSQQKHEVIANALAEKYNGEILCIHNPPCVLINGCLNMSSSSSGQSQFWPVMTKRRVAFGQKNKKAKLSKVKKNNKSSQYQPSFSKLEECLPEFKIENIQNKRSPYQVFHSRGTKGIKREDPTRRPKIDSLDLMEDKNYMSEENANCTKIPVCSKVYVVVNTSENNPKAVCPHKPPCLMIPKCLARLISSNYIQVNYVPDCIHVPYCQKIPACYGKAIKDATKVKHSKSACHIV